MNKHTGRWNEWSARWILERCVRHGVRDVVLCPGSRSTPLAVAAAELQGLNLTIHYDERGAGFYALGLARASERPVIWMTTSGTAVANGLPAVVEASQSRIPLLLLTADRPAELRGCGANQAIDQVQMFGSHSRYFKDLSMSNPDMTQGWYEGEVDRALQASRQPGNQGPVHLNLMIREPLLAEDREPQTSNSLTAQSATDDLDDAPELSGLSEARFTALEDSVVNVKQGLLVVGGLRGREEKAAVRQFVQALGWPCVTDVDSGLRFAEDLPTQILHLDLLLKNENVRWAQPETVLWIGGPLVSRSVLEWLGREQRSPLIRVSSNVLHQDPLHRARDFYVTSLVRDLPRLTECSPVGATSDWTAKWMKADGLVATELAQPDLSSGGGLSQLAVAQMATQLQTTEYAIFAGNSLTIRELDQVGTPNARIVHVAANRGASGIDGLIASAAGDAAGSGLPTLAVVGDLSFLHDVNSLSLLRQLDIPCVILVVNNDGGGIFHFLPVQDQVADFETLFATPHGATLSGAAALYGLPYAQPATLAELRAALQEGLSRPGGSVIEVNTSREDTRSAFESLVETVSRLPIKV